MRDCFVFGAVRGIQAGREFFVVMCPLRQIPRLFLFAEEELPPELRAQRNLSQARVPSIAKYIVDNPTEYVFSSLAASVDGETHFDPHGEDPKGDIGLLSIPMSARIVINDGQHRRAAIEEALKQAPHLGRETISVVFFRDLNLSKCQQMFADLNRHATRPTRSLSILYDHRDPLAQLVRRLTVEVPTFKDFTEMEKTSIPNRSVKLFTLNSLYQATSLLLRRAGQDASSQEGYDTARKFWTVLGSVIPEWERVRLREISSSWLRKHFVHAHGVTLQALGRVGGDLLRIHPEDWEGHLDHLSKLDWSRDNTELWQGRALVSGRMTKGERNVVLIANVIKGAWGISLTSDEERIEKHYRKSISKEAIF